MVRACAVTHFGLAQFCADEIAELIQCETDAKGDLVFFDATWEQLVQLSYRAQTVFKILAVLDTWTSRKYTDILDHIAASTIEVPDFGEATFKLRCTRRGQHDFSSQDVVQEAGGLIKEKIGGTVDLKNPDIPILLNISDDICVLGIDVAGIDLSKREYRIFQHTEAIKATFAALMLRVAGYTSDKILLDPFCGGGSIPIEAALQASGKSHLFFSKDRIAALRFPFLDEEKLCATLDAHDDTVKLETSGKIIASDTLLHHVKSTQKNAKIAGIHTMITVSRLEVTWLETKHDEESIELIVTNPPVLSKVRKKGLSKTFEEFYYQGEYILTIGGKIVLCTTHPDVHKELAQKFGLKILSEHAAEQGKMNITILCFEKTKKSKTSKKKAETAESDQNA